MYLDHGYPGLDNLDVFMREVGTLPDVVVVVSVDQVVEDRLKQGEVNIGHMVEG